MKTETSAKKLLETLNRTLYIDEEVLEIAPRSKPVPVKFFKLDKYMTAGEVEKEYADRGLVPASVDSLVALGNEVFDEKKYVATQWKDAQGRFCYLTFDRWLGKRYVDCYRYDDGWDDLWWLAGVPAPRKVSTSTSEAKNSSDTQSLELSEAIARVKEEGYVIYKPV